MVSILSCSLTPNLCSEWLDCYRTGKLWLDRPGVCIRKESSAAGCGKNLPIGASLVSSLTWLNEKWRFVSSGVECWISWDVVFCLPLSPNIIPWQGSARRVYDCMAVGLSLCLCGVAQSNSPRSKPSFFFCLPFTLLLLLLLHLPVSLVLSPHFSLYGCWLFVSSSLIPLFLPSCLQFMSNLFHSFIPFKYLPPPPG